MKSDLFLDQLELLDPNIACLLEKKLDMAAEKPSHFKRLRHELPLFVIKFSHRRQEKRLVFLAEDDVIRPLFILDRKHDYRDLEESLRAALDG